MRQMLFAVICFFSFAVGSLAQTPETFDIATFQSPKGWNKQATETSVRLSTEDKATGAYCLITLFKSIAGTDNSKENFDLAWRSVVTATVNTAAAPQTLPIPKEIGRGGWEAQAGYAAFEKDGAKGVAILMTLTGFGKMVNVLVLSNTQAYDAEMTAFAESISLKTPAATVSQTTTSPTGPPPASTAGGYGFSTTKFDDGWTSTIQEDWVQVTKGNGKVLIHYPNKVADAYNSVLLEGLRTAWNVLAAPKYSSVSNFQYRPTGSWEAIEWAEASAVEIATGKTVYVVLFKKDFRNGTGKYMEFIFPNKSAFEQEFGAYDTSAFGTGSSWDKMVNMANYNKFGVAAADLKGKWTNDFSGSLSYVNAYTGADAGTDTHASVENFSFGPGSAYKWDLGVASGAVGNIKFQSVKSSGTVSVPSIWQAKFSSIEGKPRTFRASFSCVKGARILWLDGKAFGKLD